MKKKYATLDEAVADPNFDMVEEWGFGIRPEVFNREIPGSDPETDTDLQSGINVENVGAALVAAQGINMYNQPITTPYGPQFTPSDIKNHLDNNFYTRTRKIKITLSLETFKYIRQFTQRHCTIEIYNTKEDQNALLTNRAIIELMIELMDKLNKKMQNLKPLMTITFTIPQAWAFTEIYSAIDAETMNEYTFATIQPIVDTFNKQLL